MHGIFEKRGSFLSMEIDDRVVLNTLYCLPYRTLLLEVIVLLLFASCAIESGN